MSTDLEKRIRSGSAWVSLAVSAVGILDVLGLLILFEVVKDAEFGIARKAAFLFPVLDRLADLGMSTAIVQRDGEDQELMSAAFWLLLTATLGTNVVLFGLGYGLSVAYGQPVVMALLVGYGVKMLLQVPSVVPTSLMKKELRFRQLALIRIVSNVGDFCGKVGFALAGYHVFCWVAGPIVYAALTLIAVVWVRRWRPTGRPRIRAAIPHFLFGIRSSAAEVMFELYNNLDYQVCALFFSDAALGLYAFARELIVYPVKFVSAITVDVAFPSLALLRTDHARLEAQFLRFVRQNLLMGIPVIAFVLLEADDVPRLVFPNFIGSEAIARVLCIVGFVRTLSLLFPPLVTALGRPDLHLGYAVIATVFLPALSAIGSHVLGPTVGILAVAIALASGYPMVFAWLSSQGLRLANIPWSDYLAHVGKTLLGAVVALVPAIALRFLQSGPSTVVRLVSVTAAIALGIGLLASPWGPFRRAPAPESA